MSKSRPSAGPSPAQRKSPAAREDLPIWPHPVQGRSLIRILEGVVDQLRQEDQSHGNRRLYLDDVFVAYLLAFFNPSVRSLRTIEDFSQTKQAQKCLNTTRICRSTLADFNALADPERLQPILAALRAQLGRAAKQRPIPGELAEVLQQVLARDGTILPALASVAWAVRSRKQRAGERHRARLDWQVDVHTWIPVVVTVPDSPTDSEAETAARQVVADAITLYDRAYGSFDLIAAHYERLPDGPPRVRGDFVIRLREPGPNAPLVTPVHERPLSAAAQQARVVSDRWVRLPGFEKKHGLEVTLREIVIELPEGGMVRLLTSLLDLPAEIVALLYRQRWQVELFFRWLKCYANFNHLISHSREGVLLNFYVVIIGVMLMYLQTGGRPSKYLFVLLGAVAQGGGSLSEILPILQERERQSAVARASAAKRRAKKRATGK